jgi:hypothetical protein
VEQGLAPFGTGGLHLASTFITGDARLADKKELKIDPKYMGILLYPHNCCILFDIVTVLQLFYLDVECL